jgi:Transposase/Transposase IS116/IS110/IS902 family
MSQIKASATDTMEERMESKFVAYVGLDWADRSHRGSMKVSGSELVERFGIVQKPQAIQQWVGELRKRFGSGKIAVALEQKRGALIYGLMKYNNIVIFPLNTTAVKNYRKALRASGAKDDRSDADLQLEFLEKHISHLRRWEPEDVRTRQLRFLVESRRKLVDQATALSNQITAQLKESYPVALEIVGTPKTLLACDFLSKWPNLRSLNRAKAEKVKTFFHKHNSRSAAKIANRLELVSSASELLNEKEMIVTYSLMLKALVNQLRVILTSIKFFEVRIEQIFASHPDQAIYKSFAAAGAALAPRLAVAFGEDRSKFENAAAVLNFTGIAPITKQSGKSRTVSFRFVAPKFQRQTFIEFSRISTQFCSWARLDYLAYRKRGSSHQAAIRRIAYKWIRIMFRCWKNRIAYDEQIYLAAREKHKRIA